MKLYYLGVILLFITGCQFQKPDYLAMVSPVELNQAMQQGDIFLMDVHTPIQRHIKGTDQVIAYNEIDKYQSKLPQDKNTPIYIYCKSGPMGNSAAKKLHEMGYLNLKNLAGGTDAWQQAGFAFE